MTFYELLRKFTTPELWYIISRRHDLSGKPIKAERMFNLYKSAHEELIKLHAPSNPRVNVLVCEFTIDSDGGGAPDSWVHCNMLSPKDDGSGEMAEFAIDFVSWNELIDCKVHDDSLAKLGGFVCAAELLWEITFHGFSAVKTADEADKLKKLSDDIDKGNAETFPWNPDEWKPNESEIAAKNTAIAFWLRNAPDKVREIVCGFYTADVCIRDEDADDVTVEKTLRRLKAVIDESTVEDIDLTDFFGVLRSMLDELDVDKQHLVLSTMQTHSDATS
jgi:hypothetical protein